MDSSRFVEVTVARYAVDGERRVLLAAHPTGAGDVGFTVAVLPDGVASDAALRVTARLDGLSRALWRSYSHPAAGRWGRHGGQR